MFFTTAIATLDTTMTAMDWTRNSLVEGLTSLGYWQNTNSRRAIAFLESDRFHQFIRHTALAWVIFCIMVHFVAAMLTPPNSVIISASDRVVTAMDMQRPIILSTFTANDWPDDVEQDLALLNGWS